MSSFCHLSLSPNLLFCWGHDGFQLNFYVCQQVQILTAPKRCFKLQYTKVQECFLSSSGKYLLRQDGKHFLFQLGFGFAQKVMRVTFMERVA